MDNKTQNEDSFRIVESNVSPEMNKINEERLERLFLMMEKSNAWKSKYEYYQLAKDVNENSIIVSET